MQRVLEQLARRLRSMVVRGVVTLVDDARKMQAVQVTTRAGEDPIPDAERWEAYGLTAHPQNGAEALVVQLGGTADNPVVIVVADRRYRLQGLAQGEVALYDDLGQKVHLTRDGIVVTAPTVTVVADHVHLGAAGLIATDGVVHGTGIDPFTGATYAALQNTSGVVRAKK